MLAIVELLEETEGGGSGKRIIEEKGLIFKYIATV
jgi:hypothetical protein